jgi:hypothetical protein
VYDVRGQYSEQGASDISSWDIDLLTYNLLLQRFYGENNVYKVIPKLRENGLDEFAKLLSGDNKGLRQFVKLDTLPPFPDITVTGAKNGDTSDPFRQLKALLLNLTIMGVPRKNIVKLSSVIRDNFENITPVYLIANELNSIARNFRAKMARIMENKFNSELALKSSKAVLIGLDNIQPENSDRIEGLDLSPYIAGGKTEYLPIEYQIEAAKSKIVQLEEKIKSDDEEYEYYKNLLILNNKLSGELEKRSSSYYTVQQFSSYLTLLAGECEDKTLRNYLNSYIKRIENRISKSHPLMEEPRISRISKGTVNKSVITFLIFLMLSIIVVFLSDGIQQSQKKAS